MGFLDELKRRLAQQEGQHPPLVMNDPGISGRDTRPSDVITGIPQQPTPLPEGDVNAGVRGGMPMGGVKVLTPANQAVITRPRQVMDNVRAAVAQPQQQMPQVSPNVDTQPNFRNDTPEATRDRRTQPRDYIADDEAALRTAEAHPDGFWKRFGSGLLSRAITRRGDEPIPITAHDKEVRHLRNQLGRDVKVAGEQARIDIARDRPRIQREQQDEREINNALTQYNRLETYDPDDPKDAGVRLYLEQRNLHLPKKDKYHRPTVTRTGDGRILITDSDGTQDMQVGGQTVTDTSRVRSPLTVNGQTVQATPSEQARIVTQTTEGAANRGAANTRNTANITSREGIAARGQEGQTQRAGMRGRGGAAATTDKTALRRAAQLTGEIEKVRKDLEAFDATSLGQRTPEDEAARKDIANRATKAMTELNNLGAGYEAGIGTGGYPYYKQTNAAPSDLDQPIVGTPTSQGPTLDGAIKAFKAQSKGHRDPTPDELDRIKKHYGFQ